MTGKRRTGRAGCTGAVGGRAVAGLLAAGLAAFAATPGPAWAVSTAADPTAADPPAGATTEAAPAHPPGYEFLGDLISFERTDSGMTLRCEPGAELAIRFLAPGVFRVTLDRPDVDEDLLEWPVDLDPVEAIELEVVEEEERLLLRSAEIDVAVHRSPCRLAVLEKSGFVLAEDEPGLGIGWDGREVRVWKSIAEDERFFGLGEKTGNLDKRGAEWVMWNSDTYGYGNETDPVYQSHPFLVGQRGGRAYGIYLNNSHRSVFNLGAGNHRYWSFAAEGGALDYVFFHGPTIPRVVERYTAFAGRTPMPPAWALGYQQSRWSYFPRAEVLRLARTFREKAIPADVIYLDIHYMDGYRVFTWDPERFPDPDGMLAELGSMGFKVVTIIDPAVKEDPDYAVARQGRDGDHFVRYPDGEVYVGSVWPGRSYFPDFSRAETRGWWGDHLAEMLETGVDGFWNDMNEPAVWGKAFPLEVVMGDEGRGSSMKRMHNLYASLMARATVEGWREHRPDDRPFVVTRAGFAGIQRHATVWTGDNVASWDHLELGIRMLLGLGLSGVPFTGMDVGGFVGSPSPELFARWIQVGAFTPFFRTHTVINTPAQEPWAFGEHVEGIAREAIELRYRMLPTLYSLFREAHETGAPILRPLFWHHPDDSTAYAPEHQNQFLVGERLLVAPVTREGHRTRTAYLPAGTWLHLASGTVFEGRRSVTVEAPLEEIPTFLGAGGILFTRAVRPFVEPGPSDALTLEVFPGEEPAATALYEDDQASRDYEREIYRRTRFETVLRRGGIELTREVVHDRFAVAERLLTARFHAVDAPPGGVTVDGRALERTDGEGTEGWTHDAERRILTVRFRESGDRQTVVAR